jgi:thiopeptide-type bacteriocin biosynthesis protein
MSKVMPDIVPAGFFALRTPLLPFDELVAWSAGLVAPTAAPEALAAALAEDRALLRQRLQAAVMRPEVREALFVASRSLDDSFDVWRKEPDSERGQKVERTLVRYFARMAGRPTPFGLFAGCSVGTVAAATQLELAPRADYQRHTRLDGDYLATLTATLGQDREQRRAAIFRPNSSLYRVAERLRYAEARLDGKVRSYTLVAVETSEALEATLLRAAEGSRLDPLIDALVDEEITRDEAADFVHQLVDSQILVSDLAPQVTGPEPIHDLITQLRATQSTQPIGDRLDQARAALAALDASPLGVSPAPYHAVATLLRELPGEVELSRLFQVDMVKPARAATLGPEPLAEIARGVALLHRLGSRRNDALARFREAFSRRYEQREVPLTHVLDEESGIGFDRSDAPGAEASPLLDGLAFGGGVPDETVSWGARQTLLLDKLATTLRTGARELSLTDKELEAIAAKDPLPLPHSFAAMAVLAASSAEAFGAGHFRVWLSGAPGPSGANLLGRFCHGDAELLARVQAHLADEEAQRPDAIFAEIVHLPEGRIGNVLLRPLLRQHEIPYLGRSGAPLDQQVPVDDLLVSIAGARVVLRSRRLGREVIPRLTTAHNFSNPRNLGVYRFLCALQYQGVASLGWSWGALDAAPYLPRVVVGRLVLSLARWRIKGEQLKALGEAKGSARFALTSALRRELDLPRWVALADGDNVLPLDLDNALAVDTFAQLVKGRPSVTLTEIFPGPELLCATGPEGRFVHELVVPFLRPAAPPPPSRQHAPSTLARTLPPGSDWLYVKLYTGTATADSLLRDVVATAVAEARARGAVERWFFIRYSDPDWHLRLRFCGAAARLRDEVLPIVTGLAAASLGRDQLWKLQLDTYERELERYGGDAGMALSEQLFAADSDAVLGIVALLAGDAGSDARWRLTLRGMDQLLDDLGFDLAAKRALLRNVRDGFAAEFAVDGAFDKALGDKFRKERASLEALLDRRNDPTSDLAPGFELFATRSEALRPVAKELRAREAAGHLGLSVAELAASYLHMHANRLLRSAARAQELVIYDFLCRLYDSQAARARRATGV